MSVADARAAAERLLAASQQYETLRSRSTRGRFIAAARQDAPLVAQALLDMADALELADTLADRYGRHFVKDNVFYAYQDARAVLGVGGGNKDAQA